MTAPSKNKDAAKGAPSTPTAPAGNGTGHVDYMSIDVAEGAKPITRITKNSVDLDATPFPTLYARTRTTGQPLVFGPLPNEHAVTTAVNLLRKTATRAGGGIRLIRGDKIAAPDGKADVKPNTKGLSVKFQAADKKRITEGKPRRPRPVKGQSEAEYAKVLDVFKAEAKRWNDAHPDDLVALTPAKSGK